MGMLAEIDKKGSWEKVEKITKGWSSDEKYLIQTKEGEKLLLRVADSRQYEAKKREYDIITRYSRLGIPMSMTVAFGSCQGGEKVYMILTWVEGKDLKEVLAGLPEKEQYLLGRKAGEILKKIHSVTVEKEDLPEESKKAKKLLQLSRYEESKLRMPGDERIISYVKENIDYIWREKPVYMHGDYHPGNLLYQKDGSIGVIDFNRWEVGDPYEEFYKLESFGVEESIPYCIGQIDAYFGNQIPEAFWVTLAVYVAHASLYSIKWAEKFGQKEIEGMIGRYHKALEHYDGFRTCIPKWYTQQYQRKYL